MIEIDRREIFYKKARAYYEHKVTAGNFRARAIIKIMSRYLNDKSATQIFWAFNKHNLTGFELHKLLSTNYHSFRTVINYGLALHASITGQK